MYVNVRAIIEREINGITHILVQKRTKHNQICMELPGGRLEEYESFLDGLSREVYEETGLTVNMVEGIETRLTTNQNDTNVECIQPFAVYQTLQGPVDSMGTYFRCRAEGEPLERGDDTEEIRWITIDQLKRMLESNDEEVSWVDRSGMMYYVTRMGAGR